MNLNTILNKLDPGKCSTVVLKQEAHDSISLFNEEVYYIEPEYNEIKWEPNSHIIIFSAPGASGKTQLAQYLAYKYHGLYWNLAKIILGENSFVGTLFKALNDINRFREQLCEGRTILLLDAFDEAEMISGRKGIELFLKEISDIIENSSYPSVLLFARTDSANFLAGYCKNNNIPYSQFEIGFFTEANAKLFIREGLEKRTRTKLTSVVDEVINQQFSIIRTILGSSENSDSFLGYAPVLQALSKSFDEEKNTIKILEKYRGKTESGTNIICQILEDLLIREQKKVRESLSEKWKGQFAESLDWETLYTPEEQIVRVVEYILFNSVEAGSTYLSSSNLLPELEADYVESIERFVPQHPFVQDVATSDGIDFTGPAFRDYALSIILGNRDYEIMAYDYFDDHTHGSHFPSQLLFDFYTRKTNEIINGDAFPILYESFKANENVFKEASVEIIDYDDVKKAVFNLIYNGSIINEVELIINDLSNRIKIDRVSNMHIDTNGIIDVGKSGSSARIRNSSIFAKQICLKADSLLIEASENEETILVSLQNVDCDYAVNPRISVNTESGNRKSVKIAFPNINSFYKLKPYGFQYSDNDEALLIEFQRFIMRVMSCMRGHKKDTPAKDKEFIDNIIISKNTSKRLVMDFLLDKEIIYIDTKESHLYKLNIKNLTSYGIGWCHVANAKNAFSQLYSEYRLWKEVSDHGEKEIN